MGRASVLAVEDDPGMRQFYRQFFAHPGAWDFSATIVGDGIQALGVLRSKPVDIMILDWNLPGISGTSLAKALRENEKTRALGILIVSARKTGEDTLQALKAGADDYLSKPFDENVLMARLHGLAKRRELGLDIRPESLSVPLTVLERNILQAFLRRGEGTLTRRELCRELWGQEEQERWTMVVDAGLASLLRKLGPKWAARFQITDG